jgi:spore maturation protein CgeB
MSKTILFVSSGGWDAGLMASYRRAFEALGFRVVDFDLEAKRMEAVRGPAPLRRAVHRLMGYVDVPSINARANRTLVTAAMELQPAAIVVSCNEPVRAATLAQLRIGVPSAKLVNIFPDTLFNMRESLVQCLPLYDVIATHTKAGLDVLRRLGCRAPLYLPLAADPKLHHAEALSPADVREFGCDVVYVGNWRQEHEQLFDALEGFELAIWGSIQWWRAQPESWARSRYRGRALMTGLEYSKAHCAAKVALNPIDPMNFPGHNMRAFELPACRVFSLVTRTPEIQELFEEGKTIACFEGVDELRDKIRYYLAHPDERERIADAAYQHVVEGGHTYRDRALSLFAELGIEA